TLMRPEAAGPAVEVAVDGDRRRVIVRTAGERPRVSLDGAPLALEPLAANAWGAALEARAFPDLRRVDAAVETGHATVAAAWDWPAALRPRPRASLPFPAWSESAVAARPPAARTERDRLHAWPLLAAVLFLLLETWLRRRRA
ncbi:MAG: hypothetical protein IT452_01110, partial [Planctomycetia bacterium]|nr:hypothetical protein [Planctomycetia bacterium]